MVVGFGSDVGVIVVVGWAGMLGVGCAPLPVVGWALWPPAAPLAPGPPVLVPATMMLGWLESDGTGAGPSVFAVPLAIAGVLVPPASGEPGTWTTMVGTPDGLRAASAAMLSPWPERATTRIAA